MSIHHAFTKSIGNFHIYRKAEDFQRMIQIIRYYQYDNLPMSYANFRRLPMVEKMGFDQALADLSLQRNWRKKVEVLAYCIMHTHFHLIVNEIELGALSKYMGDILNSYTRFFNRFHNRKGPLWQNRFKRFSVLGEENLLRTAVYVHLNPVTSYLVDLPQEWRYSSYHEIKVPSSVSSFCVLQDHLALPFQQYCSYVCSQIDVLRQKAKATQTA